MRFVRMGTFMAETVLWLRRVSRMRFVMRFEENKAVATTALFSVFVATCLGPQCDA